MARRSLERVRAPRWSMGARFLMLLLGAFAVPSFAQDLGLDLSDSASLKGVMVLPPIATVTIGKKGPFAGVDTRKQVERFDLPAHQKLVTAIDKQLGGKVLGADVTEGVLSKEKIVASGADSPASIARLAQVTAVQWVVGFRLNKNNVLAGVIYDPTGKAMGEPSIVGDVTTGLSDGQAISMASLIVPKLLDLEKARVKAAAPPPDPVAEVVTPPPAPVEELVDTELEQLKLKQTREGWKPERNRVRLLVAVGPGAALRDSSFSGATASGLATLENGGVVGLGVNAQLYPLEFFDATGGQRWSQLSIEAHYRRAFVRAEGVSGESQGQSCTMTDDDLQVRGGWRFRIGDGYLPTIGVAGGWSQEQTTFACNLPLVSTAWRGVDVQLRIRQPLFQDIVTLELVGGPRFVLPGPLADSPAFSVSAEAWVEVKPVSVLFARAGGRFSRLQASSADLTVLDTRAFIAAELGVFF